MLRSRHFFSPYEMNRPAFGDRASPTEAYFLMNARHAPEHPLQESGHAGPMQTQQDDWYFVHRFSRPLPQHKPVDAPRFASCRHYMPERDTARQRVCWAEDGWLRLRNGTNVPDAMLSDTGLPPCPRPSEPERGDFDTLELPLRCQDLTAANLPADFDYFEMRVSS